MGDEKEEGGGKGDYGEKNVIIEGNG